MMKVTAAPTWKWKAPDRINCSGGKGLPSVRAGTMALKQTLLPRSLDVSFEFKYRR